ncbi:hybrid sensor histidine kinase/response regulator [Echinicola strongylocentroti]|uniref:histidine kinase n=1 Tax=Echinicola strongylocentroti TaxID=1795355 RepID=A0A2Z4ICT5_9BACT|nr:hybrid sensor histidine kinase/response regulator transcription factor [Echinicola strongylocentroti]AWW28801.1 hybrid sensor histidine kinase/response regulator [Echinicola strongylocentroti]
MVFRSFILFLLLVQVSNEGFTQSIPKNSNTVKFKNISLKEGLSQSSVLCVLQDDKGFLWFGTRDGLNKYDGDQFLTYRYDHEDEHSLSSGIIKSLFQDSLGTLWVGTQNGLNKFIPEEKAFERIVPHIPRKNTSDYNVSNILPVDQERLWVGTNYGLAKFDIASGSYVDISSNRKIKEQLGSAIIRSIFKSQDGQLWIKTVHHIFLYDPVNEALQEYDYPTGLAREQNENQLSTIYEDSNGRIWLGIRSGLAKLDEEEGGFKAFKVGNQSISSEVRAIKEDHMGNLWIGTYKGLYQLDRSLTKMTHLVHDENNPNSLSQNSVYDICEDSKGDIWIGTYAGGVNHYDRSFDLFKHFTAGTNNTKLNYKVVSSIVEDKQGNLWVGTEGGGINFYDQQTGKFTYFTHDKSDPHSLSNNNVKAIIQDYRGGFWIGTHEGGLNYLNPKNKPFKFEHYQHIPGRDSGLADNRVIALHEDSKAKIWIGTSGGGLNVLDAKDGVVRRFPDPNGQISKIIFTIISSDNGDYIIVGGDKGIAKINTKTKEVEQVEYSSQRHEVERKWVLSLFLDEENKLWVGTEGEGVFCYDQDKKSSVQYGVNEGLPSAIIYGILPDDRNNLWFSTNRGLSRMNTYTETIKNFEDSDGLQSNEFNYGAVLKNAKGELLFGGANGLNLFDPAAIQENTFIPPIAITGIDVHNKPFLNITEDVSGIDLNYDQDVINIDFVALSYSQPDKNQYAYMLEGFDKEWNYIGNKHSATYTNLDAGDYVFKVKASNNDGLWNEKGAVLPISIQPAPWATWWAYSLYVLIVLLITHQGRRYWLIRSREKNELREERLAKERIEEVNRLKLQLFTNISHDFRTPLTLIVGPLQRMMQGNKGDAFIQQQHKVMFRNASVLMQLINELLDFRKNEAGKLQLQANKHDLVALVKEVKLAFEEIANIKNIQMDFDSEIEFMELWYDRMKLQKVLFNLLSNAFKYTPNHGHISLSIAKARKKEKEEGYAVITIADNGKGISKESLPYVFDRFYQQGERTGSGIGLALSKSIIALHQGTVEVESEEGKGTTFTVKLPLGNAHIRADQLVKEEEQEVMLGMDSTVIRKNELLEEEEGLTESPNSDPHKPSILVTEDNGELRAHLCSILHEKYNVYEASNGQTGLKIALSRPVDLILSDVMMPRMDGMELCDLLKSNIRTSHIPIVLLTAKTSEDFQKSGYKKGADAYITKPFDAEILCIRIDHLITSRRLLIEKFKKDIILQPKEVTVSSADEEFLDKAITIVEKHLKNEAFNAAFLVSEMAMSRSVVYRKLKDLTDQSISEFIRTIKLKRAAQLLKQSDMTISEISFELGFNDKKYFRDSFKALFNCLPSVYRNGLDHQNEKAGGLKQ